MESSSSSASNDKVQAVVCKAVLALMDMMVTYSHSLKINLHLSYETDGVPHKITYNHCLAKANASTTGVESTEQDTEKVYRQSTSTTCSSLKQAIKEIGTRESDEKNDEKSEEIVDKLAADIGLDFVRQFDWPEGEEEDEEEGDDEKNSSNTGKYACKVCGKSFTFATNLTRHEKKIHGIQPPPNKNFEVIREAEVEEKEHNDTAEAFKCTECGREFPLYQNLGRHLLKVHKIRVVEQEMKNGDIALQGKGDFVCSLCGHRFSFQSNLSRHFAKVHKRCPKAKRHKAIVLSSPEGINKNKHVKKNDRARHKCELCGCRFTFRSNLNRHMNKAHRHKRSPLRTLRSSTENLNEAGDGINTDKQSSTSPPTSTSAHDPSPTHTSSLSKPAQNTNPSTVSVPKPAQSLNPSTASVPAQNLNPSPIPATLFQTPVNHWNSRRVNPPAFVSPSPPAYPSYSGFTVPQVPSQPVQTSSSDIVYTSPGFTTPVLHTQTSRISAFGITGNSSSTTPTTSLVTQFKTSPYTSPNVAYTPTQPISPMSQISPSMVSFVSPYASPMNNSSSLSIGDSVLMHPSSLGGSHQNSPSFFCPLSTTSSPVYQPLPHRHSTPKASPTLQNHSNGSLSGSLHRNISPVIIRPTVYSATPSPTNAHSLSGSHSHSHSRSELEIQERSATPTGPLSPLVPPPELEISSRVSPSHGLALPPPQLAGSPEPHPLPPPSPPLTKSHTVPTVTLVSTSIASRRPSSSSSSCSSIPTSFSIPHLSSNIPTTTSSSSILTSSVFSSSTSIISPHYTNPLTSPLHITPHNPVHPSLLSLGYHHQMPPLGVPPPSSGLYTPHPGACFVPPRRGGRKFGCTLCSALFSFEANARRHFLSQHATALKDVPMFREIMLPVSPTSSTVETPPPPPPTTTITTTETATTTTAMTKTTTSSTTTKRNKAKKKEKSKPLIIKKEKSPNNVFKTKTDEPKIACASLSLKSLSISTSITSPTVSKTTSLASQSLPSLASPKPSTSSHVARTEIESTKSTKVEKTCNSSKENSTQPIRTSNGKSRRFICEKCPATYTFRTNLTRHMRQKHGGMD